MAEMLEDHSLLAELLLECKADVDKEYLWDDNLNHLQFEKIDNGDLLKDFILTSKSYNYVVHAQKFEGLYDDVIKAIFEKYYSNYSEDKELHDEALIDFLPFKNIENYLDDIREICADTENATLITKCIDILEEQGKSVKSVIDSIRSDEVREEIISSRKPIHYIFLESAECDNHDEFAELLLSYEETYPGIGNFEEYIELLRIELIHDEKLKIKIIDHLRSWSALTTRELPYHLESYVEETSK